MTATKRDGAATTVEGSEVSEGSKRLHLSVTRMKKLRAGVKGGPDAPAPGDGEFASTANSTWVLSGLSI